MASSPSSRTRTTLTLVFALVTGLVLGWSGSGPGPAANPLKSTRDRLALLYSTQFNFTRDGEPLIHAGVLSGVDEVRFSSDGPLRIVPIGEGATEISVDVAGTHTVKIEEGRPGTYRHWVVVDRIPYSQVDRRDASVDAWVERGYLPTTIEVGGLFAIGSRRFDSRAVLVGVGGYDDRDEAINLAERLTARYGIETELHSEILTFPGGNLVLTGKGLKGKVRQADLLWVAPASQDQELTLETSRGDRRYKGALVFTADAAGHLSVVNAVPTETFLKGVVPSEVYASAPIESLKAQAVAARGTLLSAIGVRHLGDPYLLCSDVHCQMYEGLSRETARTNQAVDETRGVLMLEPGSAARSAHIADARYSSSCGGHTEDNDKVWGDLPQSYLRGGQDADSSLGASFDHGVTDANVKDWLGTDVKAWCNTSRYGGAKTFRWTKTVDADTLQAYFDRHFRVGRITDARIDKRGVSGRVIKMTFVGDKGTVVLDRELSIRRAFDGLRSSLFTMTIDRDSQGNPRRFAFVGGGFGHGAGMCQTGAMMMAHAGKSYSDILTHYYQGVTLERLY